MIIYKMASVPRGTLATHTHTTQKKETEQMNRHQQKREKDIRTIETAVIRHYLKTKCAMSIKEITDCEMVPFSESKIRKIFNENYGTLPRLSVCREDRSTGNSFSGAEYRAVNCYAPSREVLADMINERIEIIESCESKIRKIFNENYHR
jgi:hypothetical protein